MALTARLVRYRWRSLARRLGAGRPLVAVVSAIVIGLALVGLIVGGSAVAAGDASDLESVYQRVFWLGSLGAIIWGYTSFEVFFRPPDRRLLASLPIDGGARFDDLFVRAVVVHLPLILPGLAYAVGLARAGQPTWAAYAAASVGALFVAGLPLSIALHMWAGRSLASPSSELKRMLAGGVLPDEAALLVYAPAVGLIATLALGIFADLVWRSAFIKTGGSPWPALAIALAIAVVSYLVARRIAASTLHHMMPRFSEVDLPAPYTEDGLPKKTGGQELAPLLPARARPYFMRDLRQLRRRYRLDKILLWVFALAMLRLMHGRPPANPAWSALLAVFLVDGVFFVSAFRLRGELASTSLERTLPVDRANERWARWLATSVHPAWVALIAAVSVATMGAFADAALVLGVGLGIGLVMAVVTHVLADIDARVAWPWRCFVVAMVGLAGGWL